MKFGNNFFIFNRLYQYRGSAFMEFDNFLLIWKLRGGSYPPRTTFFGILKMFVVVCLFAQREMFLKACTAMFILLNGHYGESLSTFLKKSNFWVFGGHFYVKMGGNWQSLVLIVLGSFRLLNGHFRRFLLNLTTFWPIWVLKGGSYIIGSHFWDFLKKKSLSLSGFTFSWVYKGSETSNGITRDLLRRVPKYLQFF